MSSTTHETETPTDQVSPHRFSKVRHSRPQVRKRKRFKASSIGRCLFYGLPIVAFVTIISIFVVSIATVKPVEVPFQDFRGEASNEGGLIDRDAPVHLDDPEPSDSQSSQSSIDSQPSQSLSDSQASQSSKDSVSPVGTPSESDISPTTPLDPEVNVISPPETEQASPSTSSVTTPSSSTTTTKPSPSDQSGMPAKGSTQYVLNHQVYVREGAGTEHPIAGFGLRGMSLKVLEPGKEWSKIRTENSLTGYMLNELFGPDKPANVVEEIGTGRNMYINTDAANLREEPSTDSERITVAYMDEKVYQISTNGGWSKIRTDAGITAYIRNDLLRDTPPVNPFSRTNRTVYIDTNVANVRRLASTTSAVVSQVRRDERLTELETNGTWSKVKLSDGKIGYIHGDLLTTLEPAPSGFKKLTSTVYVNTGYANVRSKPNTNGSILTVVRFGEKLKQLAIGSNWTFVEYSQGNRGYISTDLVVKNKPTSATPGKTSPTTKDNKADANKPAPTNPADSKNATLRKQVAQVARSLAGTPYVLGGCSTRAVDCSGLVKYAYNAVGYRMTYHGATGQAQMYGTKVSFKGRDFSPLLPGDMIFFSKGSGYHHVGIYLGNNQMVHATSKRGVVIDNLMNYYQIPALVKRIFD